MPKPAIEGGRPVRRTLLPYGRHTLDDRDRRIVERVLRSDWITQGPWVARFENAFAKAVGARHAVAVSSGTAALHACMAALDLEPGDEVIVPAITFAASANAALYAGATPVIADVDPDTGLIDPASVASRVTDRTRAVVAVHYAGHPAPMRRLGAICREHGPALVVDAAHALGSAIGGRTVGSTERLCAFSTHPVKHVTTGEGGVVTMSNGRLAERLRRFRNHGIVRSDALSARHGGWYYEVAESGYNYRLDDIGCALGCSQLAKLDRFLRRRRNIAREYDRKLVSRSFLDTIPEPKGARSAYHIYPVLIDPAAFRISKKRLFAALRAENIGVQVHYIPLYRHPLYRERLGDVAAQYPGAERFYEREITLPLFPSMTYGDLADVLAALDKLYAYYGT